MLFWPHNTLNIMNTHKTNEEIAPSIMFELHNYADEARYLKWDSYDLFAGERKVNQKRKEKDRKRRKIAKKSKARNRKK